MNKLTLKEKFKKCGKTVLFGTMALIGAWGLVTTLSPEKKYASGEIDVKDISSDEEE